MAKKITLKHMQEDGSAIRKQFNCGKTMAQRVYGTDTGCQCNQCRADRRRVRMDRLSGSAARRNGFAKAVRS